MGVYQLIPERWNEKPVWKMLTGNQYIYQSASTGNWLVSGRIGGTSCHIGSSTSLPLPTAAYGKWEYVDDTTDEWEVDESLKIRPYTEGKQ